MRGRLATATAITVLCLLPPAATLAAAPPAESAKKKPVQITMRLMAVSVAADGKTAERLLQEPILSTQPDEEAKASIVGSEDRLDFAATPHWCRDGHINLSIAFHWDHRESAAPLALIHGLGSDTALNFRPGETKSLYVGSIPDRRVSDAIMAQQRLPATGAPYVVYRLDLSPREVASASLTP